MKIKDTVRYLNLERRFLFFLLAFLFQSVVVFAQQPGIVLFWDSQVGCLAYDEDRIKDVFIEDIAEGDCAKVCENSVVTYTLQGDNIASVSWSVTGGVISTVSSSTLQATVLWGANGNGFVNFDITLTNGTVLQKVFCIHIITGPKAEFTVAGINSTLDFCADVPLYLINTSHSNGGTQLVSYLWDFGDNTFSNAFEPVHSYANPGHYTITLQVWNECQCVAKYRLNIRINTPALPISCPTVVCEGAVETYTVEGVECEINWKVEGGHIISTSSDSVQVIWDDVAEDGFGYLSALDCNCPVWTTVKIPVIKQYGTITGETQICVPNQYRYKLPQWPGTFYEWTITDLSGGINTTTVIQTDQLNEAIISAQEPGNYLLKCVYINQLTGCGGVAELAILINDKQDIEGIFDFCTGTLGEYATNYTNPTWELSLDNVVLATSSADNFSYLFNQAGVYVLTVSSPEGCSDSSAPINVFETGVLSDVINGEDLVCKDLPYTYSFPTVGSLHTIQWTATGGTIQGPSSGNEVVIVFEDPVPSSGYYEVTVVRQLIAPPFCVSEPVVLQVYPKAIDIVIENVDNLTTFCPSSFASFTFDFDYTSELEDITWRIVSDLGNTNFGNIVSGQGTSTVTVSWNEVSETDLGKVFLDVRFCGKVFTFEYDVTIVKTPVLSWNLLQTLICAGDFNPFFLEIESDITLDSGTIIWDLGNGSTYSQTITSPGTTFASGMLDFQNIYDTDILQTITVSIVNPNGCNTTATLLGEVTVLPSPRIAITPGYNYGICLDSSGNFSVNLTANVQGGLTLVGAPEWYKENGTTPIYVGSGVNITITNATGFGDYYALAIADNGCVSKSRKISIYEFCPQASCALSFTPVVSASIVNQNNCYSFQLTGSFTHSPANVTWFYPSATGLTLTSSTNTTANFEVLYPGNYVVFYRVFYLNGEGQMCMVQDAVEINVPFLSDIRYELSCLGQGAYDLTLLDNSTHILTDAALDDLVYTFYINGSPVQSGPNSTFNTTTLTAGTYTLGLQLSHPHPNYAGITSCLAETTLTLYSAADAGFTISHVPNCTEQVVILTLNQPTQAGFRYEWNFDGTSFVIPNQNGGVPGSVINLQESGLNLVDVRLTITDPNGCVVSNLEFTDDIVSRANFPGEIEGGGSFCNGDSVQLIFNLNNPFNPLPNSFQWMQGNNPIAGATSQTFSPTQSGNYWVVLYNAAGCSDKRTSSTTVTFYPTPAVSLSGPDTVCANDSFVLRATISGGAGYEKRWVRNGVPQSTWNVSTPLTLSVIESVAGVYVYRYEVRDAQTGGCMTWAEFEVTVFETPEMQVGYVLTNCSPYEVKLFATSTVNAGIFLWSDGQNGATITVSSGGAYSVTFIASSGCAVTQQLFVPKNPEVYMWLFPSGCLELCKEEVASGIHLPAPNASFTHFSWDLDQNPILVGDGYSPDYLVAGNGSLTLSLSNELCTLTSETLTVNELRCEKCEPKFTVKGIKLYDAPYLYYEFDATFENSFSSTVFVEMYSPQGFGIFIPSTVTISSGSVYAFSPLTFVPDSSFTGGGLVIRFLIKDKEGNVICFGEYEVEMPFEQRLSTPPSTLKIVPNPTESITSLEFDLVTSTSGAIIVYDMLGIQRAYFNLTIEKGNVVFDASILPSGNYVVVLFADGKAIQQQILLKK